MKRPQGVQGQTRQDILNQRLAFQKTRVEALQKAIDARQELMKVLTPEQVKVFDAVESRTHARGPRGGFGPGHRGYHHGGYGMMYQQGVPAPQGQQQGGSRCASNLQKLAAGNFILHTKHASIYVKCRESQRTAHASARLSSH